MTASEEIRDLLTRVAAGSVPVEAATGVIARFAVQLASAGAGLDVAALVAEARADEREKCAKVCDEIGIKARSKDPAHDCAASIRALPTGSKAGSDG